uniref:Integrase family protein n=1 Tax=uncultured Thiotrichaceae bacterium TaxID=298394 RepID=A0A6S6SD01_9GAMM|nr:MAG: Integrase family protein [uncultured Thiotrichaceae bacterium]
MTKYSTHKLSDPDVRHAKPKEKLYRLRDGGGLSCDVLPTGSKVWRYSYRFNTKQKTFTIGNYPGVSLSDARKQRDAAKDKVKAGIDPSLEKQTLRHTSTETSFHAIAEEWYTSNVGGWSEGYSARVYSYLKRDVYPVLGRMEISSITAPTIIMIVKTVADGRGAVSASKRVKSYIQQVFDYALVHGQVDRNPAKDINLSLILPKTVKKHFAAITEPSRIRELLQSIEAYRCSLSVKAALRISPLVFLRPTELRAAEWSEIDLSRGVWTLPAKRRKLPTHLKKANRSEDALFVPLSRQAVSILSHLYEYTGRGVYVFPSPISTSRPISNNTVRTALRNMGYTNADMTAHGFRAMASTRLNELGYRSEVIEAQLGHKEKNEIRAAYNHADYLEERTTMMQEWADYLDSLNSDDKGR